MTDAPQSKVLKKHAVRLACELTDEERIERGKALAGVLEDIGKLESDHEAQKRQMKSEMAALEARRNFLQVVVSRGSEYREVEVEDVADFGTGKWMRFRLDTGTVVSERVLNEAERQQKLVLEEAPIV